MPPSTITTRLDDDYRRLLEGYCAAHGVSASEAIRQGIDLLVGRDDAVERRSGGPTTLTAVQRQMLALQHQMLALIEPAEADYHSKRVEVLTRGFSAEYGEEFPEGPEMTPVECSLLWDILDMFRVLEASLDRGNLGPEVLGGHEGRALRFDGFDMNDATEGRLLRYMRFLVEDDRWEEFADRLDKAHDRGNSHSRRLPTYRRLLAAFQPIWQAKTLTAGLGPDGLLLNEAELTQVYASVR